MSMLIREPIWGDVEFDDLEEAIIRTPQMQRLAWIRQLGTVYVAYPGATHTRFEHSLGTCHISGKVFDAASKNSDIDIPPEERTLVRLLGLLHDISHVPFGHVLEDELRLFGDETHDTRERLDIFLKPISENPRVQQVLDTRHIPELLDTVSEILSSKPGEGPKPYLLEMVKDTVCADLLDYLRRDYYSLGIRRQYDERIYHYFSVALHRGKPHFIVELTEEGHRAEDSLTEIEHLLRIRYTMAERAFYHPTKLAADAMLDKAIFHSDVRRNRTVIDWLGDEGLLNYLEQQLFEYAMAGKLGKLLRARDLYKPAYMVSWKNRGTRLVKWQKYMEPEGRREAEHEIAKIASRLAGKQRSTVNPEDVTIFCPQWEMNMKEAAVLVRDEEGQIRPLKEREDSQAGQINDRHMRLWRFYAFCPRGLEEYVGKACERQFGFPNEYVP